MCRITSSLAVLLSLLMVSTSASASACDLSCWFYQEHSDCHTAGSAPEDQESAMSAPSNMDMGPGMNMGAAGSERMMAPDQPANAKPDHSMSPKMDMTTRRFEQATKPELSTSAMPDHSMTLSSCTHETCSQISASASPPNADHSQPNSLYWIATDISNPGNLWTGFHSIRPGPPPPKILAVPHLTTTLRI
jgi:hypothetical protein